MIERKILISLIVSTEYCQKIKDFWNVQLLESSTAKLLSGWCWEYFNQYHLAPGREIETIYHTKLKEGKIAKDVAKEIEEKILPGLSAEYENETFHLEALLDQTKKHLTERHLTIHKDTLEVLLAKGQIEEAEKLAKEFKPLGITLTKLDCFVLTVNQIRKKDRPRPVPLLNPWLKQGQGVIIYANYGTGKSLLAI
jgi:hypothetical protein